MLETRQTSARLLRKLVGIAMAFAYVGAPAQAEQAGSAVPRSPPSWQTIAGWPDLTSGMWQEQMKLTPDGHSFVPGPQPVFTEKAKAYRAAHPENKGANGGASCAPPGLVGMMTQGYSVGFYYAQNAIFLITDMDNLWLRRIFTDRKDHGDPDPSWFGNSLGHWEGDVLVVETTAFNPDAKLSGVPQGDKTVISERFRLSDQNTLTYQLKISAPEIYAQPYVLNKVYKRRRSWEPQEAWCGEQNRSSLDAEGNVQIDLTPPKQ